MHSLDGYDVRRAVLGLVAHHLKPSAFQEVARRRSSDGAFRRLAQKVDLELLARFAKADCHGRTGASTARAMDWFLERARAPRRRARAARAARARTTSDRARRHAGPAMGELLKTIYERQLDGEITTLEEGQAIAREILTSE